MDGSVYTIRFNRLWAVPAFLAGLLNAYVATLPSARVMSSVLAVMFLVLGALFLVRPMLVVSPHAVEVKNLVGMTMRTYPLDSLADLEVVGGKLSLVREDGDRRRIRGISSWLASPSDWQRLTEAIAAAQGSGGAESDAAEVDAT